MFTGAPVCVCVSVCVCGSGFRLCQDVDQLFGELAKWVRKHLHRASSIDDFVASLQLFLNTVQRPFDRFRRVIKLNTIRNWKDVSLQLGCAVSCVLFDRGSSEMLLVVVIERVGRGGLVALLAYRVPILVYTMYVLGMAGFHGAHRGWNWRATCAAPVRVRPSRRSSHLLASVLCNVPRVAPRARSCG